MEKPNFTDGQIDDYLMGRAAGEDKSLLEKALVNDEDLNLRLQERKDLVAGVEEYHAQLFKDKLKKIHRNNFDIATKPTAKRRSLIPWLAAAASIALLIVALFWLNGSALSSDELYAANFEPYELSLSQRDDVDPQELQAETLYTKGQYSQAIPIFETLIAKGNPSAQLQLGAGIAKLETNRAQEALGHFKAILTSGDLLYQDHARWYSALAHLKLGEEEQSKSFLKILADDEAADHHEAAIKLLKKIE